MCAPFPQNTPIQPPYRHPGMDDGFGSHGDNDVDNNDGGGPIELTDPHLYLIIFFPSSS